MGRNEPPFPLDGGGAGDGGGGATSPGKPGDLVARASAQASSEDVAAPSVDPDPPASTPIPGPSPIEGEGGSRPPGGRRRWGRALLILLAIILAALLGPVIVFRVLPPPVTFLMLQRAAEGRGLDKSWRPLSRMAASLPVAAIAAEDARFCEHRGFDWDAMEAAAERNAKGGKVRGGSTISQQTAKNVFLWPHRDYVRKGLEAGYTVLIETLWGKRRIMEVYLNVVEWGPGVYGAEAAARRYFNTGADRLTPQQSARLVAILPSPLKWRAVNPGRYVRGRSRRIGANARIVRVDDLAWCVRR